MESPHADKWKESEWTMLGKYHRIKMYRGGGESDTSIYTKDKISKDTAIINPVWTYNIKHDGTRKAR